LSAVLKRAKAIVKKLEALIEKQGEDAVLYDLE
jgi:hypothetical protein